MYADMCEAPLAPKPKRKYVRKPKVAPTPMSAEQALEESILGPTPGSEEQEGNESGQNGNG